MAECGIRIANMKGGGAHQIVDCEVNDAFNPQSAICNSQLSKARHAFSDGIVNIKHRVELGNRHQVFDARGNASEF